MIIPGHFCVVFSCPDDPGPGDSTGQRPRSGQSSLQTQSGLCSLLQGEVSYQPDHLNPEDQEDNETARRKRVSDGQDHNHKKSARSAEFRVVTG